jgi:signal transduction histidine kinase
VIIADDASDIRMLLRLSLGADGRFEVVGEAEDGAAAIALAERAQPDVVVLDLSMPVMDGLQAATAIRSRWPEMRIVVLSGFTAERMSERALACGADRYVEKGSAMKDLADTITALCPGRGVPDPRQRPAAAAVRPAGGSRHAPTAEVMTLVSHELQTPLSVLKGFAAVLRAGVDSMDREQILASAEAIERNADNLTALTRSFADARAVEDGLPGLVGGTVDLGRLAADVVGDLSVVTRPHCIGLRVRGTVEVHGDPVRLRQVLTNLLSNAVKFSPAESPIELETWASGTSAFLSVVDHGPGIPPEREHELFGKFCRLASSTKGTGLGLYISRGIARAHGGELTHHRNPSGGARFLLELPLSRTGPTPDLRSEPVGA